MNFLKCMVIGLFAAICCVGCGGGSGSTPSTFDTTFQYYNQMSTYPMLKEFTSQPPAGLMGGENFVVSSGSLPPGFTLNAATGVVSGISIVPGSYSATVTLTIKGYTGSGSTTFAMTIESLSLVDDGITGITQGTNYGITAGTLYDVTTEQFGSVRVLPDPANGVNIQYQMAPTSTLPVGLTLDSTNGNITGTANLAVGVYPNIQFEAIVTYLGKSYTYLTVAKTITVIP